ncbi:hypothetical protein CXG81DRAFT_27812 [Caulochytrium protostelioides]|uniref:Sister chromatid cohesion protein Dcc1 n=1 Tax=Caulochytrium protostelioides TaxID=1555241 RepID=A0A4P9X327_9FUNG|nr:hypothetical protein CXG81DRAFT_27812 [Caulochytrium protostelioides]|eukprot:RKO99419.1 hypothetical protein CXG81DRAFT_27812 [Caulochytrium protostelioides]
MALFPSDWRLTAPLASERYHLVELPDALLQEIEARPAELPPNRGRAPATWAFRSPRRQADIGTSAAAAPAGSDPIFLCTSTHTYQVKAADSSNSTLVAQHESEARPPSAPAGALPLPPPPPPSRYTVHAILHGHWECLPITPRPDALIGFLDAVPPYNGPFAESQLPAFRPWTTSRLVRALALSPCETQALLREVHAICIGGPAAGHSATSGTRAGWRRVAPQYGLHVLQVLCLTASAEGWPLDALPVGPLTTALAMEDVPSAMTAWVLQSLGEAVPLDTTGDVGMDGEDTADMPSAGLAAPYWALKTAAIARYVGVCLLMDPELFPAQLSGDVHDESGMPLDAFMALWASKMPAELSAEALLDRALLVGKHIVAATDPLDDGLAIPGMPAMPHIKRILPLDVDTLPAEPAKRFARLFAVRDVWTLDEMAPFLQPIVPLKLAQNLAGFAVKYARLQKERVPATAPETGVRERIMLYPLS